MRRLNSATAADSDGGALMVLDTAAVLGRTGGGAAAPLLGTAPIRVGAEDGATAAAAVVVVVVVVVDAEARFL